MRSWYRRSTKGWGSRLCNGVPAGSKLYAREHERERCDWCCQDPSRSPSDDCPLNGQLCATRAPGPNVWQALPSLAWHPFPHFRSTAFHLFVVVDCCIAFDELGVLLPSLSPVATIETRRVTRAALGWRQNMTAHGAPQAHQAHPSSFFALVLNIHHHHHHHHPNLLLLLCCCIHSWAQRLRYPVQDPAGRGLVQVTPTP